MVSFRVAEDDFFRLDALARQTSCSRAGKARTYHLVIALHPEDRSLDRRELRHVVEHLVDTLGFSDHQYIAARHNDKDHEHIHVAINKIHPETFRMHSPAWDHQKLFAAGLEFTRFGGRLSARAPWGSVDSFEFEG